MDEENTPQTVPSKSAFSGTSDDKGKTKLPIEIQCKAYQVKESGRVRFGIWKPTLEMLSGVRFERGRMYVIRGTIDGCARFESKHVASNNSLVYVFAERSSGIVPRDMCTLKVETLEEKRKFTVIQGKRGPVVRLTRTLFEGVGIPTGESVFLELAIRKCSDAKARKVYSRWDPLLGFMELQLGGAGFSVGDTMEVLGGRRYAVGQFVTDFGAHRFRELTNVELDLEGETMTVTVDGKSTPVERYWLTTHGLKAALKLELGHDHRMMKFVFDGSSVEARFANSDPILEYSATAGGLDVRYSRVAGQAYVMRLEQRSMQGAILDLDWLMGGIQVIERPKIPQGRYLLRMSEAVQETTRRKLNEASDDAAYKKLRGDIGEEIVKQLFPTMKMKLLYDHPWSELNPRYGSLRHGPDFMVTCMDSDLAAYLEGRWQENVVGAFGDAKDQVSNYLRCKPDWKGVKIGGAYIAILDWKVTETAKLWVERIS